MRELELLRTRVKKKQPQSMVVIPGNQLAIPGLTAAVPSGIINIHQPLSTEANSVSARPPISLSEQATEEVEDLIIGGVQGSDFSLASGLVEMLRSIPDFDRLNPVAIVARALKRSGYQATYIPGLAELKKEIKASQVDVLTSSQLPALIQHAIAPYWKGDQEDQRGLLLNYAEGFLYIHQNQEGNHTIHGAQKATIPKLESDWQLLSTESKGWTDLESSVEAFTKKV